MSNQTVIASLLVDVGRASRARISSNALLGGLLGLLVFFALEVPDWLILLTAAPVPWLGHWMPYAVPLLLSFLIFNFSVVLRARNYCLVLLPGTVLFAIFIFTLVGLALAHWMHDGGEISDWLVAAYFWIFIFYITLRSFDLVMKDGRAEVVKWSVRWILLVGLIQFIFADVLSDGRGLGAMFFAENVLFDSAYVAYLSVFGIALLLFEMDKYSIRQHVLICVLQVLFLAVVIYSQRLNGPMLLLIALLCLKTLTFLPEQILRGVIITGMMAIVLLCGALLMKIGGGSDPSLQGLRGGPYLFDEYGHVHGDIISSFTRIETIRLQMQSFLTSPLWGVGMAEASSVKVIFLGMHSSFFYVLVTSGLIGFGVLLLFWGMITYHATILRGVEALALPGIWLATSLLTTEPVWWWSIIVFLIVTPKRANHHLLPGKLKPIGSSVTAIVG